VNNNFAESTLGFKIMGMHKELKERARVLRREGKSLKDIEAILETARSNISLWVRDIQLSEVQLRELASHAHSKSTTEKRRTSRLRNETARRMPFLTAGIQEILDKKDIDLAMLGIGIYLGEGTKTNRGTFALSNTDPRIIQIFILFLERCFGARRSDIRGQVGIHTHLSVTASERYWSKVSGIPLRQFTKAVIQHSRNSKGERDKLPYGTFTIYLHGTERRIRFEGWIQGVYQRLFPQNTEFHHLTKLKI
jgi:hypothetical protein